MRRLMRDAAIMFLLAFAVQTGGVSTEPDPPAIPATDPGGSSGGTGGGRI